MGRNFLVGITKCQERQSVFAGITNCQERPAMLARIKNCQKGPSLLAIFCFKDQQPQPLSPPQQQQSNNIRIIIQQQSPPNPNPPHPLFSGIVQTPFRLKQLCFLLFFLCMIYNMRNIKMCYKVEKFFHVRFYISKKCDTIATSKRREQ